MACAGKVMAKRTAADTRLYPLSQEQINQYWDNGYLVIKKLYDLPTLNMFRDRFVEICNMKGESRKHFSIVKDPKLYKPNVKPEMYINKIQELLYDEIYMKYSEDPKMLDIVSQFIGDDLTAVNCMLINKPPGTQRHPAHQDLYYFPFRPADKIIATWTAVDPVYRDNGCLFVVPGSHKIEAMYIHGENSVEKKQFFHTILKEEVAAPAEKQIDLIMAPGDTVFFHPYLVHGSRANVSQDYRKAMTIHYGNSSCHYIDVTGTPQEVLAETIEAEIRKRHGEFLFADLWRFKSKPVKGLRSNL